MEIAPIEELGKGIWFMIHFMAKKATTKDLKEAFEVFIGNLATEFPCEKCRPHFVKMLYEVPLNPYRKEKLGYFDWSIIVHNKVNLRLGKRQISKEEAYKFYIEEVPNCPTCIAPGSGESEGHGNEAPVVNMVFLKPSKKK